MATQFTPILQLALPVTGELNGTWGDVVNDNITSMVEEAIAGKASISTWTANSHTLTTADGTTDEARCAMLVASTGAGGTALTAAGEIICPARTKLFVLSNGSAYAVTLKTAAGSGVAVAAGDTAFLFCDGTDVKSCVTQIVNGHITGNLTVDGNSQLGNATLDTITATARFASDLNPSADNTYDLGTASNSWRNLYIDGTATIAALNVTTIDTTNIEVTNIKAKDGTASATIADATGVMTITSLAGTTANITNVNATTVDTTNIEVTNLKAKDGTAAGSIADATGVVTLASAVLTTADINAGTIDNATIGATTPSTGVFTQVDITAQGDLRLQDSAGGQYVALQAPGTVASSYTLTLPVDDGTAGQALVTDGSGVLSWSSAASGDVYGPASATDNAVARFDGTTGKIIQNSALVVADDGSSVLSVNSASDGLRITQTGAGNALVVEDSANPDATPFVIDSSGYVIQGSTVSYGAGSFTTPLVSINHGNGASYAGLAVNAWGATGTTGPRITFARSNGALGTYTSTVDSSSLGGLYWHGADGTSFIQAANITAAVDGTPGTNDMPGRLVFSTTADGASSPTERLRIDNAGRVGIGGTPGTDTLFGFYGTAKGTGTSNFGVRSFVTVPSTNTSIFTGFESNVVTQAASFNIASYRHFVAGQTSIGAGSSITNQFGFYVENNLTGATNNYGFYSNIAAGTGRYNFYAAGSADNYFAGSVGIGSSALTGVTLNTSKSITGAASSYGMYSAGTVQSDVTTRVDNFLSLATTQAAAFTLAEYNHYRASSNALGASSAITNQYGFNASSSLTTATNNYGFYSNIASGTGRWNFYAAGTAQNYFAGLTGIGGLSNGYHRLSIYENTNTNASILCQSVSNTANPGITLDRLRASGAAVASGDNLGAINFAGWDGSAGSGTAALVGVVDGAVSAGSVPTRIILTTTPSGSLVPTERMRIDNAGRVGIGGTPAAGYNFWNAKNITGGTVADANITIATIQSDVTSASNIYESRPSTAAASFTLASLTHYLSTQGTIGAGSVVTNQFGFVAESNLTGATNNYGFRSNIASGTGRWNFYASGTASNYFAGDTFFGSPTGIDGTSSGKSIQGATGGSILASSRNTTSTANHVIFYNSNGQVGSISTSASATAYTTSSDYRLKENIEDSDDAGYIIDDISIRSFDWKSGGHQRFGVIAQELDGVFPEAVSKGETDDDMWSVDYSKLVPMLVKEIQSLRARVAQLEGA